MTATEILSELERRGVRLEVVADRLRFRPKEAVTPELVEVLKQHKGEILTVLQSRQPATSYGLCPGPDKCGGCYSVGVIDGRERFIHPPKVSPEWNAWLTKWQPKKGNPIQ